MEKNTKEYNAIKNKMEKCFDELNFDYKFIDLDDNDINYRIVADGSKTMKYLNKVWFVIFADTTDVSLTLTAINIYGFAENEDLTPFYKKMNDVNGLLSHGKFSINEDIREIVYSSSINCSENFGDLNKDKISFLTKCFFDNIAKLLLVLSKRSE